MKYDINIKQLQQSRNAGEREVFQIVAAKAEEKINMSIEKTHAYALNLSQIGDTKDAEIADNLVNNLTKMKQNFFAGSGKTPAKIKEFQRETRSEIITADKQLSRRYDWKPVVGNLIIGFSGISLLASADADKAPGLFFKHPIAQQVDKNQEVQTETASIAAPAA